MRIRGFYVLIGLIALSPAAMAGPLGLDEIPKQLSGSWAQKTAGEKADCSAPSLTVSSPEKDAFEFVFTSPEARQVRLELAIPTPQVVGAPPQISLEPPREGPPPSTPQLARGYGASMTDTNTLVLNDMRKGMPTIAYSRCGQAKVG